MAIGSATSSDGTGGVEPAGHSSALWRWIGVAGVILSAGGCGAASSSTGSAPTTSVTVAASPTAAATPAAGPAYTAITVPPGRARVFAPADGVCPFLLDQESDLTARCNSAGYEITLTHGSESWFSAPSQTHTSGDVEVDALFSSFTGDRSQAAFGVTCESTTGLQAYFLAVKADGGWAIVRYDSSGAAMVLSQSGVAKDPHVAAASRGSAAGAGVEVSGLLVTKPAPVSG